MPTRPSDDNVIYANFGAKTRVEKPTQSLPPRRRASLSPAAQLLLDAVLSRADAGRVTRGQQYAAAGHVVSLEVLSGRVHAQVAGSQNEPFQVTIQLPYRSPDAIAGVSAELARTANGLRLARQGEVSESLLHVLLADDPGDIRLLCDCPDPSPVCKHEVAVAEKLAARMDADPLLLFELRGMNLASLETAVMAQARSASRESEDDPELFRWTCTVLTTQAEDAVGHIHDRMPLMVPPERWGAWLDPEPADKDDLLSLLQPAAPRRLEAYPVSTMVNNVRNNGPELLEPLPPEED